MSTTRTRVQPRCRSIFNISHRQQSRKPAASKTRPSQRRLPKRGHMYPSSTTISRKMRCREPSPLALFSLSSSAESAPPTRRQATQRPSQYRLHTIPEPCRIRCSAASRPDPVPWLAARHLCGRPSGREPRLSRPPRCPTLTPIALRWACRLRPRAKRPQPGRAAEEGGRRDSESHRRRRQGPREGRAVGKTSVMRRGAGRHTARAAWAGIPPSLPAGRPRVQAQLHPPGRRGGRQQAPCPRRPTATRGSGRAGRPRSPWRAWYFSLGMDPADWIRSGPGDLSHAV